MFYNSSLLLTVSGVHLLTPSSQHASVSPSAAYRAVRNSTQSVDSSPPMKRQRSLKVELVVSSPCHQIRGPTGRRRRRPFTFQLDLPAGHLVLPMQTEHADRQDSYWLQLPLALPSGRDDDGLKARQEIALTTGVSLLPAAKQGNRARRKLARRSM